MKTLVLLLGAIGAATLGAEESGRADGLVKITKERLPMDKALLLLCAGPEAVIGPHVAAEVDIFVNELVLRYREDHPREFDDPVGAVFIKEKYGEPDAKSPDAATRMEKVRSDGTVHDWEFSMYRLPDRKPIVPAGRVSCASCHERYEERGYISSQSETALQAFLQTSRTPNRPPATD